MVMPPRVAPTQLVGIPIPNAKLSAEDRDALTSKVRPLHKRHSACNGCTRTYAVKGAQ